MQEFIFLIVGIVIGIIITSIICNIKNKVTHGILKIDHNGEECSVLLTSDDLYNRNTKRAILKIDHDADFSRIKQRL